MDIDLWGQFRLKWNTFFMTGQIIEAGVRTSVEVKIQKIYFWDKWRDWHYFGKRLGWYQSSSPAGYAFWFARPSAGGGGQQFWNCFYLKGNYSIFLRIHIISSRQTTKGTEGRVFHLRFKCSCKYLNFALISI